jgi:hypothetical protein
MNLIKHTEGVYEIEGFLDEKQITIFLSEAKIDIGWDTKSIGNIIKVMDDELYFKLENVYKNIETFFINIGSMMYSNHLRRLKNSEFMSPHTDFTPPDSLKKIVFGITIYLNDDFDGGELIYPDLGLSITPKAGSMVIHNANIKHQVFPVVDGERYSISTFVFGDESTAFNYINH